MGPDPTMQRVRDRRERLEGCRLRPPTQMRSVAQLQVSFQEVAQPHPYDALRGCVPPVQLPCCPVRVNALPVTDEPPPIFLDTILG